MKLKNIFKKSEKNESMSNFKALDKNQLQKIAGGTSVPDPIPTPDTTGSVTHRRQH